MYLKMESVFRKKPELKSEIIDIFDVNTQVNVIEIIDVPKENEQYAKIKINDIEGYVILSSLSKEKVDKKDTNNHNSLSKENKIKLINEAIKILNQNTSYSAKRDYKFYENGKTRLNRIL